MYTGHSAAVASAGCSPGCTSLVDTLCSCKDALVRTQTAVRSALEALDRPPLLLLYRAPLSSAFRALVSGRGGARCGTWRGSARGCSCWRQSSWGSFKTTQGTWGEARSACRTLFLLARWCVWAPTEMQSLVNFAHAVGETITPVLTESAFMEKGVMTPDEFVAAGDKLVALCGTWQWCAAPFARLQPPAVPAVLSLSAIASVSAGRAARRRSVETTCHRTSNSSSRSTVRSTRAR